MDSSSLMATVQKTKSFEVAKERRISQSCFAGWIRQRRALALAVRQLDSKVHYVVITDADYTYPAEYIPEMVRILEENPECGYGFCGNRLGPEL